MILMTVLMMTVLFEKYSIAGNVYIDLGYIQFTFSVKVNRYCKRYIFLSSWQGGTFFESW